MDEKYLLTALGKRSDVVKQLDKAMKYAIELPIHEPVIDTSLRNVLFADLLAGKLDEPINHDDIEVQNRALKEQRQRNIDQAERETKFILSLLLQDGMMKRGIKNQRVYHFTPKYDLVGPYCERVKDFKEKTGWEKIQLWHGRFKMLIDFGLACAIVISFLLGKKYIDDHDQKCRPPCETKQDANPLKSDFGRGMNDGPIEKLDK